MYDASHHLVKIDKTMDWHFASRKLSTYYYPSQIGRPSKDPIVLVKILMIQYLEGFYSVRFTYKQVQQSATYQWFLGVLTDEKKLDHSTISKFHSQRLNNEVFWEELFHHCLLLIAQEEYIADETELKANANKRVRNYVVEEKVIEEKKKTLRS